MNRAIPLAAALLLLASCKPPEESVTKAIIGAVLIDPGSPPVTRSVLVAAGDRIRAVGTQAATPVPTGSDKVDGSGKFLIPAPVQVPNTLPSVSTLEEARALIDSGASALAGMITDTEALDHAFIQRLRDLRVVFVPGDALAAGAARANTLKLASAGVLIAARGHEDRLALAAAGLTPEQVLAAATRNAAIAAGRAGEFGSLKPGYRASVWLLSANPLEDPSNMRRLELALLDGEWVK